MKRACPERTNLFARLKVVYPPQPGSGFLILIPLGLDTDPTYTEGVAAPYLRPSQIDTHVGIYR